MDRKYMRSQAAQIDSMKSPFWKPKAPGKYRFRLLDGWSGSQTYFVDVATHYNVGSTKRPVVCPKLTSQLAKKSNRECVICDAVLELLGGTSQEKALATAMKANVKYLMNIWLRPSTTEAGGLRIAAMPKTVHDAIFEKVMDEENWGEITDINEGRDMLLTRKGTTQNDTKYTIDVLPEKSKLAAKDSDAQSILKQRKNLNEFVVAESREAMLAKLSGDTEDEEAAGTAEEGTGDVEEESGAGVEEDPDAVVEEEASGNGEAEEAPVEEEAPAKSVVKIKTTQTIKAAPKAAVATKDKDVASTISSIRARLHREKA